MSMQHSAARVTLSGLPRPSPRSCACQDNDADLWFAARSDAGELAKTLCRSCHGARRGRVVLTVPSLLP